MMVNVLPVGEEELHTHDSACPCGPRVEFHAQMLVVHNSFTGDNGVRGWGVYEDENKAEAAAGE